MPSKRQKEAKPPKLKKDGTPDRRVNNKLSPKMIAAQFKPGQIGNPTGRPRMLTDELVKILRTKVPKDPQQRDHAVLFVQSVLQRAILKSDVLAKEIFDRVEGKASMSEEDAGRQQGVSVIILDVPRPDRSKVKPLDIKPMVAPMNTKAQE